MKLHASLGGRVKTQHTLSPRNAKRLAKNNKDVIHGSHTEQVDRERAQEKDS
jgi:hypothetical protein